MKVQIEMHKVVALIVVRCDDPHGIHAGQAYIRYLILAHKVRSGGESQEHLAGVFVDDPTPETCLDIYHKIPHGASVTETKATCHWCRAYSKTS